MGFFSRFGGAVCDLLKAPFNAIGDLISEPSKRWDHSRHERSLDSSFEREFRNSEQQFEHERKLKELDVELRIKEKTGVNKALAEIDEMKKEKEYERMLRTTEAIKKYLEELTRLKTETIKSIGEMHLDLKLKAQELVYNKTLQYQGVQDSALSKAMEELSIIDSRFEDGSEAKRILTNAVDVKLSNIVNAANNFMLELNRDIVNLNNDISQLTKNGQAFIESHLNRISINGNLANMNNQIDYNEINDIDYKTIE